MKVKIFSRPWSRNLGIELEYEINEFLADLPASIVKRTDTDIVAARAENGEVKSEIIIAIWYEEHQLKPASEPTSGDLPDEILATTVGLDSPERFPKIRS